MTIAETRTITAPSVADDIVAQIARQAGASLDEATTLPPAAYVDPGYYELEVERVFHRDWLVVARLEQVPDAGDSLAVELPGEPVVVVRGEDGDVHVSTVGGRGVRAELWQGFVFVNLDERSTRPLGMDALTEVVGNFDFTNYRIVRSLQWGGGEIDADWKAALENFLEYYHHIGAHRHTLEASRPGLGTVMADGSAGNAVYHAYCPASAESAVDEVDGYLIAATTAPVPPELTPYERSGGGILVRFPLFLATRGQSYNFWLQLIPTGPGTHRLTLHALAPLSTIDQLTEEHHDAAMAKFDEIQAEDAAVNGRVQRLMHSQYAGGGIFHEQEFPLLLLQRYLAEMLTVDQA
ncbi:aromatic ring-hydroxylating oxygenase subunit alpha [Nocardioides cheoyonin]|uniref:aromatic ring-hydroxylating oxygenase subunit alpha n=1 Tax=Nocardioides cheoyonin TaxID=3156615 RepID=UPI0032B41F6C